MKKYAEDQEFGPPDNKPHNEGILLFSDSKTCYGEDLSSILSDITSEISGYNETIVADPHGEGLDLMKDDPIEAETIFLKNSLWLIHYECITENGLKDDFRSAIQATPPRTQVCIWIDTPEAKHDDIEDDLDKITDSQNVYTVKSKNVLKTNIKLYLDLHANPKRGKEEVIEWNHTVCDLLNARS
ncbi:hypothetical protein JMJ58_17270 [Haloterrigena salifodinae]|uniref:Uncharacterized protein n=1 Tax=Haloterrigena salifodinae TaxID=2675099 RepID=A0A8T8DYS3_9EURY|nr:hypothetical protein [Haloterrigena salifodinae]QRV14659.1 hypothetical protein JMJ58_17270 [Haloterrigena salifodinae]